MTKKKVSKNIQTSTLRTMPMTPPRVGGRLVPRGFIPYDGTKEEEIETLKLVFRIDGSNPYKDDAYNINKFKPLYRDMKNRTIKHMHSLFIRKWRSWINMRQLETWWQTCSIIIMYACQERKRTGTHTVRHCRNTYTNERHHKQQRGGQALKHHQDQ